MNKLHIEAPRLPLQDYPLVYDIDVEHPPFVDVFSIEKPQVFYIFFGCCP